MEKVMALALGRDGKLASRKSESIGKKRRHCVIYFSQMLGKILEA
jgi:hypothetical protein